MSAFGFNRNISEKTSQLTSNRVKNLCDCTNKVDKISAPVEVLVEFLSSVMMRDYEKALAYCAQILQYEPNNTTAKEFYPLLAEKLEMIRNSEYSDSGSESSDLSSSSSNKSCSSEHENEYKCTDSDGSSSSYSSLVDDITDIEISGQQNEKLKA